MRSFLLIVSAGFLWGGPLSSGLQADSPLETQMNKMRRSFKELKKALEAPVEADKPKYLGWVADLKKASEEAKTMEPEKTEKIPEDKKKAFLEGYRSKMEESIELTDELGKAIEAGKWVEAKALLGQMNQVQREGHREYRTQEH